MARSAESNPSEPNLLARSSALQTSIRGRFTRLARSQRLMEKTVLVAVVARCVLRPAGGIRVVGTTPDAVATVICSRDRHLLHASTRRRRHHAAGDKSQPVHTGEIRGIVRHQRNVQSQGGSGDPSVGDLDRSLSGTTKNRADDARCGRFTAPNGYAPALAGVRWEHQP